MEEDWDHFVPEITFVLFLCNGIKERVEIEDIPDQATATYPRDFVTLIGRKKIPDLALVLLTLTEAARRTGRGKWGYVAGDWFHGWRVTKKGLHFAKRVERKLGEN